MKIKKMVIAGANGFMGSRLVAEALRHNVHVVALARTSNGTSAEQRVLAELAQHALDAEHVRSRLTVYPYDMLEPHLGLGQKVVHALLDTADAVVNITGNTNFFPKDIKELFVTNVEGTTNIIETLCKNKAVYHHVSTAYVSGMREGMICEDELEKGQEFKNHYEHSKYQGELRVRELCTERKIPFNVFRPSIVIRKHFVHGKRPNLNHFYSFIGLMDILRQDAETRMHCGEKDIVRIPVRFIGLKNAHLNFVDLDYAIRALFYIATCKHEIDMTYHLVNHMPPTNQRFLNLIMEFYRVEGFEIVEQQSGLENPTFHERLIKRGLANYINYFFVDARFDDTHTRKMLAKTDIECPPFDLHYLASATGHARE